MPQPENAPGAAGRLQELAKTAELSSYREHLLEQILSVELIQACWLRGLQPVELAHAFVDFSGYDLVASCGAVTRHIQLKATAGKIVLHQALASKPSGCCVLLTPSVTASDETPRRIIMKYRFLGGSPNEPPRDRFPVAGGPRDKVRPHTGRRIRPTRADQSRRGA